MGLSLKRSSGLDVALLLTAFTAVVLLLSFALDPRPAAKVAHLWGRALGPGQENACPTNFGNEFWFECASQVRRLS
jgi:hypothetical protein